MAVHVAPFRYSKITLPVVTEVPLTVFTVAVKVTVEPLFTEVAEVVSVVVVD
jgi:hypothetical protein